MAFRFLAPELVRWDELVARRAGAPDTPVPELLALPVFSDERPLRGAAGIVDWRLCGRLSRLLIDGHVQATLGEATLYPGRLLPFGKLLVFGMGPAKEFGDARFRRVARDLVRAVDKLAVKRWAIPLPGRASGRIAARAALDLWLDEVGAPPDQCELWLVETPSAQKDLAEALGKRLAP